MKNVLRASTLGIGILVANHPVHSFAPPSLHAPGSMASTAVRLHHKLKMGMSDTSGIQNKQLRSGSSGKSAAAKKSTDPTPVFYDFLQRTVGDKANQNYMKLAAGALAMALAFMPLPSEAAVSGGRMGGSYSRSPTVRSSPVRSSPRSYSSPSGSYSRGYSQGYTSGYYSRPSVAITPGVGFGYSPFVTPYYGGGAGVISYSRGPSFFDLVFFGGLMFVLVNAFRNAGSTVVEDSGSPLDLFGSTASSSALGPGTSVVQVSVALEVPNRDDPNSILSVLNRLSRTSKTDSRVGIQNLTSQVALELLRRRSSIVSASSSYKHFNDNTKAGRDYSAKAVQERSKFERETISKYGGVDYSARSAPSSSTKDGQATMAVVTLVMAIDGDSTNVPKITSIGDIEEALRKIASDSKVDNCLQSVEILWTPEERNEILSRRDVVADYPELRPV